MNLKEIKELINLMNENNLDEMEIEKEGLRIRLKRKIEGVESVIIHGQAPATKQIISTPAAQVETSAKTQAAEASKNLIEIKAPMVGTFYRAPAPEAPPFVELGQSVNPGDVVCIIEAMKLMNEIKCEIRGKIKEILVENGKPVEFGQVLFLIDPAG